MSTDESSPVSQPPTDDMPKAKSGWSNGLKVTAGVVTGALVIGGLGLFVTSREEKNTASALEITSDFQIIEPFTSSWALASLGSGLASAAVGGIVGPFISLGMQALMKEIGIPSKEDQTLERLNQIEAQVEQIGVKIDALAASVSEVRSDLLTGFYNAAAKPLMVDRNQILDLYESYRVVFRAGNAHTQTDYQGAPDPVNDVLPTTGCWQQSCFANHGYPYSVNYYKAQFLKKYRGSSAQYDNAATEIHDAITGGGSWGTTPILQQYAASVLLKDKTVYGWRESNALRNFYTSLSEIEALAFTLKAEVQADEGQYPEARATLEKFRAFHAQEQRLLPPLLSDGFVVSIPNGPTGPAQIWTTWPWLRATEKKYYLNDEVPASLAVQPASLDATKMDNQWERYTGDVAYDMQDDDTHTMGLPSTDQWAQVQAGARANIAASDAGACSLDLVPDVGDPVVADATRSANVATLCASAAYALTWMAVNPAKSGPDANTPPFRAANVAASWMMSVYRPVSSQAPDMLRCDPVIINVGCGQVYERSLTASKADDYMAQRQQSWPFQRSAYSVIDADSWQSCTDDCQSTAVQRDPEVPVSQPRGWPVRLGKSTSYQMYMAVDFGAAPGPGFIDLRAASGLADNGNCQVLVYIDGGPRLGTVFIKPTGSWSTFKTFSAAVIATSGVHDVYLEVRGGLVGGKAVECMGMSGFQFRSAAVPAANPTP